MNADDMKRERARYMDREISHDEYYLWLADSLGIGVSLLPVSIERVRKSKDPHLNDIPLQLWDNCHPRVLAIARARARGLPWALCETVCCLKAVAKRAAAEEVKP